MIQFRKLADLINNYFCKKQAYFVIKNKIYSLLNFQTQKFDLSTAFWQNEHNIYSYVLFLLSSRFMKD